MHTHTHACAHICYCCSVTKLCPTLCDPTDYSTPRCFPVLHYLSECSNSCPLSWSILKEINPEDSLEELMLKLEYFGHLMRRADPLEKTLMLGKIEGRRRRGQQRMRMASPVQGLIWGNWETVKDRETWRAVVHRIAKSWTWHSDWTTIPDH